MEEPIQIHAGALPLVGDLEGHLLERIQGHRVSFSAGGASSKAKIV
jgi:hypothetical protein